jgi:hypothetical protein
MTTRATIAILWTWALWSVGAAVEFLFGVPTGAAGLVLGVLAGAAMLIQTQPALTADTSAPQPSEGAPASRT